MATMLLSGALVLQQLQGLSLCFVPEVTHVDAGELAFAQFPANPARVRWHRLLVLNEGATTEKSPMAARDSGDRWGDLGEEQS